LKIESKDLALLHDLLTLLHDLLISNDQYMEIGATQLSQQSIAQYIIAKYLISGYFLFGLNQLLLHFC